MPLDKRWLDENELWFASQQNLIKQIEESNEYTLKEIELHKEAIAINNKTLEHYRKGIEQQSAVVKKYIADNSNE